MTAAVLQAGAEHLPLPDDSVDLIVTSPPYFGLRSYQDGGRHYDGQVGSEATPAEFIDVLIRCTAEWMRVLKPCGSLWVNLGDKYVARQSGYDQTDGGSWAKVHHETGDTRENGKPTERSRGAGTRSHYLTEVSGIPRKSLMGLPWRYAIRCIDELGLILRAEVVWSKPNGLPESATDRVRRSHEQWFHLTLQPRYFAAVDEIREQYTGDRTLSRRVKHPGVGKHVQRAAWDAPHPLGALPGSVWPITTEPLNVPAYLGVDHFAAYPLEWPLRIIRGFSPAGICTACGEGRRPVIDVRTTGRDNNDHPEQGINTVGLRGDDYRAWREENPRTITGYACACPDPTAPTRPAVVLDPFGGTGTTALAATALGRTGITVDLSHDYCRLARWRTTDRGELARALRVDKPAPVADGQGELFSGAL